MPGRADVERIECLHHRTTSAGSNAHYRQVKCKDCGMLLPRNRRLPENPGNMRPTTTPAGICQHHWVTWKGSNGFVRIRACLSCGYKERFQQELMGTQCTAPQLYQATTPPRMTTYLDDHVELPCEQALGVLETYDNLVRRRLQGVDRGTVSSHQLHEALDLAIAVSTTWATPSNTAACNHCRDQHATESYCGTGTHVTYLYAYFQNPCRTLHANRPQGAPGGPRTKGLRALKFNENHPHLAFMALHVFYDHGNAISSENDLVAGEIHQGYEPANDHDLLMIFDYKLAGHQRQRGHRRVTTSEPVLGAYGAGRLAEHRAVRLGRPAC
eukprot:s829_g11.t2